jgi:hypothetical protein
MNIKKVLILFILVFFTGFGILTYWWFSGKTSEMESMQGKELNETAKEPYIKILSPKGGEELNLGEDYPIKWESEEVENVIIFVKDYTYSSEALKVIANDLPAKEGSYSWTVALDPEWKAGDEFKIFVAEKKPGSPYYGIQAESDNFFTITDTSIKLKKFLMELDGVSEESILGFYKLIRNDFNKDGENEIVIGIWYGPPGNTILRLLGKEGEEYKILSQNEVLGGVSSMEVKDIPLGYQSIITKEEYAKSGAIITSQSIYTYINGELKKTWSGVVDHNEDASSLATIQSSSYNIEFRDINEDGNPEIIYSGIETIKEYDARKDTWNKIEELIEKTYKWNEYSQKYEQI